MITKGFPQEGLGQRTRGDNGMLEGNVIDLAPGPENYEIREPGVAVVSKNAHLRMTNVTDGDGEPSKVVTCNSR